MELLPRWQKLACSLYHSAILVHFTPSHAINFICLIHFISHIHVNIFQVDEFLISPILLACFLHLIHPYLFSLICAEPKDEGICFHNDLTQENLFFYKNQVFLNFLFSAGINFTVENNNVYFFSQTQQSIVLFNLLATSSGQQTIIRPSSDHHQAIIRPSSGHHQAIIRPSSGRHQAVVRPSSGHRQAIVRPSSGHRQAIIRPSSGHHQAIIRPSIHKI